MTTKRPTNAVEFEFSENDFQKLSQIAMAEFGLHLEDSKKNLVYSRLAKRLRALGMTKFSEYLGHVDSSAGEPEKKNLLSALTTNVTHFFRETHHFDYLQDEIVPTLSQRAKGGKKVRIWSAGCSAGHEAYSIACTILDCFPDAQKYDLKILATDIDEEILKVAMKARYSDDQISMVPKEKRNKFFSFDKGRNEWSVNDSVRNMVHFGKINLVSDWPIKGHFDVIMCRNVAIYFNEETQNRLWMRFTDALNSGGHLMVGHSERIGGRASDRLEPVGITSYRLKNVA